MHHDETCGHDHDHDHVVREGGWEETGERMEIERASEEDDGGKSSHPSFKFPPYLSRWIGSKALPPPH